MRFLSTDIRTSKCFLVFISEYNLKTSTGEETVDEEGEHEGEPDGEPQDSGEGSVEKKADSEDNKNGPEVNKAGEKTKFCSFRIKRKIRLLRSSNLLQFLTPQKCQTAPQ